MESTQRRTIRWTVPKQVRTAEFRWYTRTIAPRLAIFVLIFEIVILLMNRQANSGQVFTLNRLILTTAGLIAFIFVLGYYQTNIAARWVIITRRGIVRAKRLWWGNIKAWRFSNIPGLHGVRRLEVQVADAKGTYWRSYAFDPAELKDADIRDVVEQYLPGKEERKGKR